MNVLHSLDSLPHTPHALTIGMFDGVHRGHRELLTKLRAYGRPTAVLTFPDHPLQTLQPTIAPKLITPPEVKLFLLEKCRVDLVLLIPFTQSFARLSFSELLSRLPISHLVLGKGASFGHQRQGNEARVRGWSRGTIEVEFISKETVPVSSRQIRTAIEAGRLAEAEEMLGHPQILYATGQQMPRERLCLPPAGLYPLTEGGQVRIGPDQISFPKPIQTPTFFHLESSHA